LDDLSGVEGHVGLVADGEDDGIDALESGAQIIFHPAVLELLLVPEEAGPGMAGGRVGFLLLQFPPVFHVGVVDGDFRTHFRELSHHDLRAAVAGVPHVLPVGGADLPHVPEGVPDELRHVEGASVVDIDRERRDLEDVVLEAHQGLVGPDAQAAVSGEAVAADSRAGKEKKLIPLQTRQKSRMEATYSRPGMTRS